MNDRFGRVRKSYFYQHCDSLPQLTKVKYKAKKRMEISKTYLSDGTFYATGTAMYNEKDKIIYSSFLIQAYKSKEETWWKRDEQQNIVVSKLVTNEIPDTMYTYSDYDKYRNEIKERYVEGKDKQRIRNYTYQYDEFGNWTERTIKEEGYIRKERREIEYFEDGK